MPPPFCRRISGATGAGHPEPATASGRAPAPTARGAGLPPRNLFRLTVRAKAGGWTATFATQVESSAVDYRFDGELVRPVVHDMHPHVAAGDIPLDRHGRATAAECGTQFVPGAPPGGKPDDRPAVAQV